jgi:hypothetical protein
LASQPLLDESKSNESYELSFARRGSFITSTALQESGSNDEFLEQSNINKQFISQCTEQQKSKSATTKSDSNCGGGGGGCEYKMMGVIESIETWIGFINIVRASKLSIKMVSS